MEGHSVIGKKGPSKTQFFLRKGHLLLVLYGRPGDGASVNNLR